VEREVEHTVDGETHRIRFQMREHRFVDVEHPIPVYIAAFGPKAQALAGELGTGSSPAAARGLAARDAGQRAPSARARRRDARRGLLRLGDGATSRCWAPASARTPSASLAEHGAAVITGLHYLVARHLETGEDPPPYARPVWKAYLEWLNESPPEISPSAAACEPLQLRRPRGGALRDRGPHPRERA
jgi:hypothetical protein